MTVMHKFYCFCAVTDNIRLQNKRFNAYGLHWDKHMSGDGGWLNTRNVLVSSAFCFNTKHQHQDQHRLSHRKSSAPWRKAGWKCEVGGDTSPPKPTQDAGSSMSYMWIDGVSETFHHRPLFLSLAGLLDQAEAPGADLTSSAAPGPRDF